MKRREEVRMLLLRSAVRVVTRDGLERTTTKSLAREAGVNETYIYRCFKNKEDLLRAVLRQEDSAFVEFVLTRLPVLRDASLDWRERCWRLWEPTWEFILRKPDDCVFYIRYYYSANFRRYAMEEHERLFDEIRDEIAPVFLLGRRTSVLLHQLFETMLSFAYRVMNGELADDEETCRLAFEQIWNFLRPHFREEAEAGVL